MRKVVRLILWTGFAALVSCSSPEPLYFTGTFSSTPVNMSEINSQYDDYNSASPLSGSTSPFCFSTNRNSNGGNFDIIYQLLDVIVDHRNGQLFVGENTSISWDMPKENNNIRNALQKLNTPSDELGPLLIAQGIKTAGATNTLGRYQSYIFLYASNDGGDLDIKMLQNLNGETYTDPKGLAFLNSDKNDSYPSIMPDSSALFFCSDRDGDYDIYRVPLDTDSGLLEKLDTATSAPVRYNALSSDGDDKCPYITGNFMVFASNRPGGQGGYDLYYSFYQGGAWTAPVNFGDKINTASDEFRPIIKPMDEFTNDMMIFSSNRSGGMGGFDLYYVGIEKIN